MRAPDRLCVSTQLHTIVTRTFSHVQRPRWMNSITQVWSGHFVTAAVWRPSSIQLKNRGAGTKKYCSLHISLCLLTASGSPADTCPDSRVNTACAEQWFIAFSDKRLKLPFGYFKYQQLSWKLFPTCTAQETPWELSKVGLVPKLPRKKLSFHRYAWVLTP